MGPGSPRWRSVTLCVSSDELTLNFVSDVCSGVNHGTFLHIAHEEGLIRNSSIHAGIRGPVSNKKFDLRHDKACGFHILTARDLDKFGTAGIIERLKDRVSGSKVYISVDIDVLDPAFAPATGTAEVGGWTTRELLTILDGLTGMEVIGADVGKYITRLMVAVYMLTI